MLHHLTMWVPDLDRARESCAIESADLLQRIVAEAGAHGWSTIPGDGHPIVGAAPVAYLEDRDGFEVELVAPG